jgi:hypothetical protein
VIDWIHHPHLAAFVCAIFGHRWIGFSRDTVCDRCVTPRSRD